MSESDNWQPPTPPTFGTEFTAPIHQETKAGFLIRIAAFICDQICVMPVPVVLVLFPISIVFDSPMQILATGTAPLLIVLAIFSQIVSALILGYWIGSAGGSPLRVRLGVYVVDENSGAFIGVRRGIIRVFFASSLGLLSGVSSILWVLTLLDYVSMLWNPNKQTWHDKVAKSVVVKR